MARRNQEFQTIRSEGGLLPPDLLRRVIDPRGSLKGTRPEDYGLPHGERLNEVITQSWNRLRRHWGEFRAAAAKLPEGEAGTGLTNDRWSLPLLRELGFGLLPTSASPEIAGRTYAISRFFGSVPIHLVGCGLSLDRRAAGVRGAAGGNPHGLVQEVLNRSQHHLWGIVGNGLRLRILRDNQALSRQSFLEFDLEAMFAAEAYSDFVLLWLVAHATRFAPRDGNRIESCWLEEWTKEAQEQGTRALKDLRGSVERALQVLGEGFTSHLKNTALREVLRSGTLPLADFHGQLLRVVYRLIFLFVAEDRTLEGQPLLHPRDESEAARAARERYTAHYGTARLRELAGKIKGSRHGDLWRQFQILVGALSGEPAFEGTRRTLALPALGSFLWSPGSTADLNGADLTNHDFLEALRHLAYTRQGKVLRPVDYRNLGAEELGGVYESLLALTPQISADGARFTFAEFAGNERKTSGSYYTPDSLVQCLLDSALDPVVEDAIKGKTGDEAEQAILRLKVCDPAVGSGHFLVGAAHRLARHLARVRAQAQGESEPSPLLYQHALRDVIGRCLYGVDLNPMAAELCRVSLWLEALEPGKPLSFLDHHIRVGNSLLGTTPELIAGGLPDEAFDPIEGDDKKVCSALKKRNRLEREGQRDMLHLMAAEPPAEYLKFAERSRGIDEISDGTLVEVKRRAEHFQRLVVSEEYRNAQRLADAWCAAFVWPKRGALATEPLTTEAIRLLQDDLSALPEPQVREINRLAAHYKFFHWHLAFPEVFAGQGFDCIVGNPPWENLQTDPQEYFTSISAPISEATNMAERNRLIEMLKESDPTLYEKWVRYQRDGAAARHLLRSSQRYPLSTYGRLNTYGLFAELSSCAIRSGGRSGLILPVGIATDSFNQHFFSSLVTHGRLVSIFGFENEEFVFPQVHHSFKFALVTIGADGACDAPELAFFLRSIRDLANPDQRYRLARDVFELINPNTVTCPVFRSRKDAELTAAVYRHLAVLVRDNPPANPWGVKCQLMFMSNTVSEWTLTRQQLAHEEIEPTSANAWRLNGYVPLVEGKMFHQFDHRFGTYAGQTEAQANQGKLPEFTDAEHSDPCSSTLPRYWLAHHHVKEALGEFADARWLLSWRDVTSSVVLRTVIASVLPVCATNDSAPLIHLGVKSASEAAAFVACLNSFALDFVARQKLGGNHLRFFTFYQLPMADRETLARSCPWTSGETSYFSWLLPYALELTYTAWDLEAFAEDCSWTGPPFRWDDERRFLMRCEIDAAFFRLYIPAEADGGWRLTGLGTEEERSRLKQSFATPRDAVAYIMDTFPIIRRKDEEKYKSDYRTKRVILEIYDAMQEAIRAGQPYQTRLDPPPGPPQDADGKFIPYAQIADNPPPHIHLPRGAAAGGGVTLQLSDLATRFPTEAFLLRLSTRSDAKAQRVRPARTTDIEGADRVVLASATLRNAGTPVPAVVGKLRVEARTDAGDGSTYVLVTVRGEDGTAQARFSEDEWRNLTTLGVVEDSAGS